MNDFTPDLGDTLGLIWCWCSLVLALGALALVEWFGPLWATLVPAVSIGVNVYALYTCYDLRATYRRAREQRAAFEEARRWWDASPPLDLCQPAYYR